MINGQPSFSWDPSAPIVSARDIDKNFRTASGRITPALKGISFDIWQGEFVSVVGRSGSGKSTLINMITGIDHVTSGRISVAGTDLSTMSEGQMAIWRGKTMGIVFQFFQLLPMLSLLENVMLPMDFCELYAPAEREQRAMQLLRRVGLAEFAYKLPSAVSGGQQQSAAIARALATDPPILMADEPTGNLDSRTAEDIIQLFEELRDAGKTILMVTHDAILAKRTTRSLIISDGELIHPAVAAALPDMDPTDMLMLSQAGREEVVPAGQPVHLSPELITIVGEGKVEVHRNGQGVEDELPRGSWIDPQKLGGGRNGVRLLAGEQGATLFHIDRKLLDETRRQTKSAAANSGAAASSPARGLRRLFTIFGRRP